MATGDQNDLFNRLKGLIPSSWFAEGPTPNRDSGLQGVAFNLAWVYSVYTYTLLQSRLATMTGGWLDKFSLDFFGINLMRRTLEPDSAYRIRIQKELLRPRNTRAAIIQQLLDLTGNVATVREAWNPLDHGGYGQPNAGYGVAGSYGSLQFPCQVWVKAARSTASGIPNVAGYGSVASGYGAGNGQGCYGDISQITGAVTDAMIYAAVAAIISAGITAWVAIVTPGTAINGSLDFINPASSGRADGIWQSWY